MKVRTMHAAAIGLMIGLGALCAASCAGAIGADKYRDAVAELCQCEALRDIDDCEENARKRLQERTSEAKEWINSFSEDCLCDKALECLMRPPLCTECEAILRSDVTGAVEDTEIGNFLIACMQPEAVETALQCFCDTCSECQFSALCRKGDKISGECVACAGINRIACFNSAGINPDSPNNACLEGF